MFSGSNTRNIPGQIRSERVFEKSSISEEVGTKTYRRCRSAFSIKGFIPSLFFEPVSRACSSVGQSTRLISVGSEVQIFPGPPLSSCDVLQSEGSDKGQEIGEETNPQKIKGSSEKLFRLEYESTGDGARFLGVDL